MTMSIRKNYSVLDTTAQTFLNTLTFVNDADAIRWFTTMVNGNKAESNIAAYPHQFILFRTSDFDDKRGMYTGQIDNKELLNPKEIIAGHSLVQEENKAFTIQELREMLKEGTVTAVDSKPLKGVN